MSIHRRSIHAVVSAYHYGATKIDTSSKSRKVWNVLLFENIMISLWVTLLPFYLVGSLGDQKRIKRVIDGETLIDRPTVYKVIKYYGFLGSIHGSPWYSWALWDIFKNTDLYGFHSCSGSLIAPMMFQTACHCVASFNSPTAGEDLGSPVLFTEWESSLVVYAGVSRRFGRDNSAESYCPIKTVKFHVHVKCARMGRSDVHTHDFALITTDDDFMKKDSKFPFPWTEIGWAPQYTTEELISYHYYALKKNLVCLNVGFGFYERSTRSTSHFLRHGWAVLMSTLQCFKESGINIKGIDPKRSQELMSWVCAEPFPHHSQRGGDGDSGGPVTCDNRYYGVLSHTYRDTTMAQALIYNLYANSVNYRSKLLYEIYRLGETYRSTDDDVCLGCQAEFAILNLNQQGNNAPSASQAAPYNKLPPCLLIFIFIKC